MSETAATIDAYVICPASAIEPGQAKAFDLCQLDDSGAPKPFRIFVVRDARAQVFGYVNACPHQKVWLNIGAGAFLDEANDFLQCGRHGAKFQIETGLCVEGACAGQSLQSLAIVEIDGDICISGVVLAEDAGFPPFFDDLDDTMEITIH